MSGNSQGRRLGAHELAAFVFCSRAGLLAYESQREDDGNELGLARLDFAHPYELGELRGQLNRWLNLMLAIAAALAIALVCRWLVADFWILLITALQIYLLFQLPQLAWKTYGCYRQLQTCETQPAQSPDPRSERDEEIDWWSLRTDGFAVIKPPEPFYDDHAALVGKPWRLLRKGELLIPVFRSRKPDNIREQHRVRIGAYCGLIEACTASQSPYGIVLNPTGYAGTAIKLTDELRALTAQHVERARSVIERASRSAHQDPPPPRNEEKCRHCPYGKTRPTEPELPTNVRGESVEPYPLNSTDGNTYHSLCGDRFHWRPPHQTLLERSWRE